MNALGKNVYYWRMKNRASQQEIAQRLGITNAAVSRIESGSMTPSVELLISIADMLDMSLDKLLGREREEGGSK